MDSAWGSSRSAYGQFPAGQAALLNGSNAQAATYFDEARQLGEDPGVLADRAFTAALLAGDVQPPRHRAAWNRRQRAGAPAGRADPVVDLMASGKAATPRPC